MNGCRVITPKDVIALVEKVHNHIRPRPLTSSYSPSSASTRRRSIHDSLSQTSPTDEALNALFVPSQEPTQSQVWLGDEDEEAFELPETDEAPPPQPVPDTMRISTLDRYLTPAFKQVEKYVKLNQILRVLQSILYFKLDGKMYQIRRIYYEDTELFKTQDCVTNIVRCLEDYWKVPCSSFNLMPAHKGMFAGPIGFITRHAHLKAQHERSNSLSEVESAPTVDWGVTWSNDGTYVYKAQHTEDTALLHSVKRGAEISWVLVVEKETVFTERVQELSRELDRGNAISHGVIVTGKGQPDLATRRMLEMMARTLPESIPFYALMDGDAYGMHIYHIYCTSIRHYQGPPQQMVDRLEWIGLKPCDALHILQRYSASTPDQSINGSGAVQLTIFEHDRAQYLATNHQVKQELQMEALRLLQYGYKFELEQISRIPLQSLIPQVANDTPEVPDLLMT